MPLSLSQHASSMTLLAQDTGHGDALDLRLSGILQLAIHQLCERRGHKVISSKSTLKANFVVSYNAHEGLQVNGEPINTVKSVSSAYCVARD